MAPVVVGNVAGTLVSGVANNVQNVTYLGFERRAEDSEAVGSGLKALEEAFQLKHEELNIDGNLYRYFAFRKFGVKKFNGVSLFTEPPGNFNRVVHKMGLLMVIVIQIVGPLSILVGSVSTLNFSLDAWKHYTVAQWATVILSWCFLFCFILNAYYNVMSDQKAGQQCDRIARALVAIGQPVDPIWLWLDAGVNCFVAVVCSWCMYSLLLNEETPKAVMMDALGLAFLLRIDDISGEMNFLGGVWDPRKVGRLYEQLRDARLLDDSSDDECGDSQAASSEADGQEGQGRLRRVGPRAVPAAAIAVVHRGQAATEGFRRNVVEMPRRVPSLLYRLAKGLLVLLLVLAVPAPFLFASKAADDKNFDGFAM